MHVGKRVRVVAALVVCLLILAGCGFGSGPRGLPDVPEDSGRRAAVGDIANQPLIAPITFSIDSNGEITVVDNPTLVTLLGNVTVSGNSVTNSAGQPLQPEPAGNTQLIICQEGSVGQLCDAYRIGTGRPIRIEPGTGILVQQRDRIIIEAAPGTIVSVTDGGSPTTLQPPYGPARIDPKQFRFEEAGQETEVDLELSGTTDDLSYDHFSGEFKPINGAQVFLYDKDDWGPDKPTKRSDYPGEKECHDRRDKDNLIREWQDAFSEDDLEGAFSIFCIRTAEGNLGLLFIEPDDSKKPVAYDVYSHTWVR